MSSELIILTGFVVLVAALALVKPAMVFEYPVAASALMAIFIVPQAWSIERQGDLADYEPTRTWLYMLLCMIMCIAGYLAGRTRAVTAHHNSYAEAAQKFYPSRLLLGTTALVVVGVFAVILINRELATMKPGELWTGPIAFYAMLSGLLMYGSTIAWIIYLNSKKIWFGVLALIGIAGLVPQVLFTARREGTFTLGVLVLLGYYFVKRKMISRIVLIPLLVFGALLINYAGEIRGFVTTNNATVIDAVSSESVTGGDIHATEVSSGVTDIAISSWSNNYQFIAPFYNRLISLYVPAFIVGRDVKDSLIINDLGDDTTYSRYYAAGSTRTGFAETFQSLHYFGCLIFFAISYLMGRLWSQAMAHDMRAQIYYILMLAGGLKVLTESASSFVGVVPLIFLSVGAVFFVSRKATPLATHEIPPLASRRHISALPTQSE